VAIFLLTNTPYSSNLGRSDKVTAWNTSESTLRWQHQDRSFTVLLLPMNPHNSRHCDYFSTANSFRVSGVYRTSIARKLLIRTSVSINWSILVGIL